MSTQEVKSAQPVEPVDMAVTRKQSEGARLTSPRPTSPRTFKLHVRTATGIPGAVNDIKNNTLEIHEKK